MDTDEIIAKLTKPPLDLTDYSDEEVKVALSARYENIVLGFTRKDGSIAAGFGGYTSKCLRIIMRIMQMIAQFEDEKLSKKVTPC